MIKIKPKPKGTTPKNLDNQKNVKVSSKPAILGKETYNYEGLKKVKTGTSMKKKSEAIKLPSKKDSPKKDYATLSSIKKDNPKLYKKVMESLGKETSKPSRFLERRMTLGGRFPNKKVIGRALGISGGAGIAAGPFLGGTKTKKKKKLKDIIKEKKK